MLVVTPGNRYLVDTLKTPDRRRARRRDDRHARGGQGRRRSPATSGGGRYDLVIYDGVRPDTPPEANALYFGVLPPGPAYAKPKAVEQPGDPRLGRRPPADAVHPRPLARLRRQGRPSSSLRPAPTVLIESNHGPARLRRPPRGLSPTRSSTFPLLDGTNLNTTWFRYISFPLFLFNSIQALGNVREAAGDEVAPARPAGRPPRRDLGRGRSRSPPPTARSTETLTRTPQGTFVYNKADTTGLYHARWAPGRAAPVRRQPVRLPRERPRPARARPRGRAGEPGRRLQDQDRLQPRRRHRAVEGPDARTGGST